MKTTKTLPKKIVVLLVISNLEFGGAQRQVIELANNIDVDKFEIHVCSLSNYIPLGDALKTKSHRLHIIHKNYKFDVTVVWKLAKLLRKLQVDIVQSYLFDAEIAVRLAGKMAGTPVIISSERNTNYSLKKIHLNVYALTRNMFDICIANSQSGADFNSRVLKQPIEKYRIVHNGVDTERFRPADKKNIRKLLGIRKNAFCVGMFGSFKEQKNHPLLFSAAQIVLSHYPDTLFLLVGDQLFAGMHGSSDYKKDMDTLVDDLGIRKQCLFLGNRTDVERLYNACDITVLPSLFEGTPNVALESMSCGIPVIATDVSDNNYIIPDGKVGYIVPLNSKELLANRIIKLREDPLLLNSMQRNARNWIKKEFSTKRLSEKTEKIYKEILHRKNVYY